MKIITTSIRIPESLYDRLREISFNTRSSLNQLMVKALDEIYSEKTENKGGK